MKLSFHSGALTRGSFAANPVSFHALLHKLEDEGYAGVELGAIVPHPTPDSCETPEKREFVKREVADHGLAFSGLSPNLRGHTLPSSDECGLYLAAFERAAKFAADLGIPAIRVDTVEPIDSLKHMGLDSEIVFERIINAFGECARMAGERHLRVCWEFEPHLPLNSASEISEVVDAVRGRGHAQFGVLFDTSHAFICSEGEPLKLLQALAGRISHVHLADSDGTLDDHGVSRHLPLGTGKVDFKALIPVLPDGWWTVDMYNCADAWDAIAGAKKFLSEAGAV